MTIFGQGMQRIAAERQRQVDEEGWTAEYDDTWTEGELMYAAMCYSSHAEEPEISAPGIFWPWDKTYFKECEPIRAYEKAGALCMAELARLERNREQDDTSWQARRSAAEAMLRVCADRIEEILISQERPKDVADLVRILSRGFEGQVVVGVPLMVRPPDGKMYVVKDVQIEEHDREESVGGTTVWLTIEEY